MFRKIGAAASPRSVIVRQRPRRKAGAIRKAPSLCHCEPVRTLARQSVQAPLPKGDCGLALPVAEKASPQFPQSRRWRAVA